MSIENVEGNRGTVRGGTQESLRGGTLAAGRKGKPGGEGWGQKICLS